jgi:hypothetical protein
MQGRGTLVPVAGGKILIKRKLASLAGSRTVKR